MSELRRCTLCKERKLSHEFFKNSSEKDGLARHCKECAGFYRELAEDGLSKVNGNKHWVEWDTAILSQPITIREMAELTGRSYSAVCVKRNVLREQGLLT